MCILCDCTLKGMVLHQRVGSVSPSSVFIIKKIWNFYDVGKVCKYSFGMSVIIKEKFAQEMMVISKVIYF
jgi:hypothetical protein